jgi:uncharacterized protein YjbI with pentapeptide repeats
MSIFNKLFSAGFFCALLFISAGGAKAMTCTVHDNNVKSFPIIFKGKVITTTTHETQQNIDMGSVASLFVPGNSDMAIWFGKPQSTKFHVLDRYKGNLEEEVEVFHQSESVIGTSYKEGETYIIFARQDKDGNPATGRCDPLYIFSELQNSDKQSLGFLQLATFKAKTKEVNAMIARQPDRADLYMAQALFYEEYNDYPMAETAYKTGMEKNFKHLRWQIEHDRMPEDSLDAYTWPNNAPYVAGYGKMLFLQEKYNESLAPLKAAGTDESRHLYKTALIQLKKFTELKDEGLDFSGIDVKELDLSNTQLEGANFSNAKIRYLILHNTNLNKANFSNAQIDMDANNTQLNGANFSHAKIGGDIEKSSFKEADFSSSDWAFGHIKDTNFIAANFSNAKMTIYQEITNSDMSKANFEGAYVQRLTGVKIEGANLNHINIHGLRSYHSDFSSVDLSGYDLSKGDFRSANLRNARLIGTNLSDADLTPYSEPADLRGADLTKANLSRTKMFFALYDCQTKFPNGFSASKSYMIPVWDKCNTSKPDISFSGLTLPPAEKNLGGFLQLRRHGSPDLQGLDLEGARFDNSNIGMISCKGCNLQGSHFKNIEIMQLSLKECDLRQAKFQNIKLAPQSILNKCDLRGADMSGIGFIELQRGNKYYYQPSINNSLYDDTTRWPQGFDPIKAGAIKMK